MNVSFAQFTQMMSRQMPDYPTRPGNGGPDDTSDPDFPSRPGNGGPDDTSDPDFGGRGGGGDYYDGPDGRYEYDPYH